MFYTMPFTKWPYYYQIDTLSRLKTYVFWPLGIAQTIFNTFLIKKTITTKFNLEMSCNKNVVDIACLVKPNQATLVPEKRKEVTTEGGLDVAANFKRVNAVAKKLKDSGILVSLFIDPVKRQIDAANKITDTIELHTGRYANAKKTEKTKYLDQIVKAAQYAKSKYDWLKQFLQLIAKKCVCISL